MVEKKQAKKQRIRMTNKAVEGLRFSTVRMPAKSEVQKQQTDISRLISDHEDKRSGDSTRENGEEGARGRSSGNGRTRQVGSAAFDPIPNDPMFFIVEKSKYWPPPSLEDLHKSVGVEMSGDGFDPYDRREDDEQARQARTKIVRGELNHPRGKPRKNTLVKLESSSGSDTDSDK
ncbi:uncharacterized protein TEOVI_000802800 [Trypanosoma equiperdum]|uniref:Uncharacterized protein n=2 Tax=Trypanozoon TaxID=39700 RepID=Q57X15_TRYB2|nr:hypothetical protein, conserved [Trypanosoma brucei brucei TREU927]AAX69852.1 hypothetical protein, conserved [Trypanosoma brucei]AAZ13331.1 hypothetical protein, conserved [Trypanosoma brucei brucei TREU927]SCU67204.1 hypothetical protein, conserved [Trypanosoma equiperdum]